MAKTPAKKTAAKKAAAKTVVAPRRTSLVVDPRDSAQDTPERAPRPETSADKQQVDSGLDTILPRRTTAKKAGVEVTVIKAFRLNDGQGEHHYGVGTQLMPKEHAEHWYAKPHLAADAE